MLQPGKLEYFLSEKQHFLVVSFVGQMNKTTADAIETCQKEVQKSAACCVVLNFHDVKQIEPGAIPGLVRLEKAIREKQSGEVRLCFLQPAFQKFLHDSGAIRPNEITIDLVEALKSFARPEQQAQKKAA